ncbi:MAG: LacI family DNA-binding transcriptional regulator [Modestobacter sp.]|nr:LacI family DNA-binding transcriptional regulator [Modestobacter sp.]
MGGRAVRDHDAVRATARPTLRDIAEEAGVSISTASRVLARARTGPPRSAAAERVVAIAERLHYQPDLSAASLRTRRTRMLGVLVPRLTDIVLSTIYEGLDSAAESLGYQTVVANTLDSSEEQRRRAEMLLTRRVDGLILGDARIDDAYLDELAARRVPFALVSRSHPPYDSVTCDDLAGGRLVGDHLADLGHRRIGIIAGEPHATTGRDRAQGCLEALRRRGVDVPSSWVVHSTFDAEGGYDAAHRLMQDSTAATAIFAVNDMTAIGAIGALRDLGHRPGTDIAVVGFNDISIAGQLPVPLTSVRSPLTQMGAEAARLLVDRLQLSRPEARERAPVQLRLAPQLFVRASSDPSSTEGWTPGLRAGTASRA